MSDIVITEGEKVVEAKLANDGLPVLLEKAAIKKDQDTIRTSLVKLDVRIHNNAVQCLMHAELHGDTSLMRRLLIDIIDEKTGYRRKGLIAWMRKFSPMELKGDVINLSGIDPATGEKRLFLVSEAQASHFAGMEEAREMIAEKPFYKDSAVSRIEAAQRAYRAAVENTVIIAGQKPYPKDPKKPFYDGIHLDKMDAAFDKIEAILGEIESWKDTTKLAREAALKLKQAEMELAAATK